MDLLTACRKHRKLQDTVFSSIQDAIIVADPEGNILFCSSGVQKVVGFLPEELSGKNLSTLFTPEDLTHLYPNLLYIARKKRLFEDELMLVRKNGTRFFAVMGFHYCADTGPEGDMVVINIQDIDKKKKLEKAFRESHYEDLIQIANGIAHELRNPITGIGGFVTRLYKSCREIEVHDKYYAYIIDNLNKIESLVEKVEFFASLPKPNFTETSIKDLPEKASGPFQQQIKDRNINLTIRMEDLFLLVDTDHMIKAFSILIENALDALSDGGSITIQSEVGENQVKITVSDTGEGIAPENFPYVLKPFFSTKADGAGIDLATVKRIMDSHGGSIKASSQQGEGTSFILTFPMERRRDIRRYRMEA